MDRPDLKDLPIVYIDGTVADFVVFIQNQGKNAQLWSIEGKFRWVITKDDGEQYIARPIEAYAKNP